MVELQTPFRENGSVFLGTTRRHAAPISEKSASRPATVVTSAYSQWDGACRTARKAQLPIDIFLGTIST
jgi:hypothetical protein